jgi:hypothetical protein
MTPGRFRRSGLNRELRTFEQWLDGHKGAFAGI